MANSSLFAVPADSIPESFFTIAESIVARTYPLAETPDTEITLPRHRLLRLLSEAALSGHEPPIMAEQDIQDVHEAIRRAVGFLELCRCLLTAEGRAAAEAHGLSDTAIPDTLRAAHMALVEARNEIHDWIKTIDYGRSPSTATNPVQGRPVAGSWPAAGGEG